LSTLVDVMKKTHGAVSSVRCEQIPVKQKNPVARRRGKPEEFHATL
jgi:hypothetical protein